MLFIQCAEIIPLESAMVTSSRESFDQAPLSAGAVRMTREARGRLELAPISGRMTKHLPRSDR